MHLTLLRSQTIRNIQKLQQGFSDLFFLYYSKVLVVLSEHLHFQGVFQRPWTNVGDHCVGCLCYTVSRSLMVSDFKWMKLFQRGCYWLGVCLGYYDFLPGFWKSSYSTILLHGHCHCHHHHHHHQYFLTSLICLTNLNECLLRASSWLSAGK